MRVRLSAHSADALGLVLQAQKERPAKDEVRLLAVRVGSAQWCLCSNHNTSVLGQVLTVWARALVLFRPNPFSANAPQTPPHCRKIFVSGGWVGGGAGERGGAYA